MRTTGFPLSLAAFLLMASAHGAYEGPKGKAAAQAVPPGQVAADPLSSTQREFIGPPPAAPAPGATNGAATSAEPSAAKPAAGVPAGAGLGPASTVDISGAGAAGVNPADMLKLESASGYLDYDEATNIVYGRERTRIVYKDIGLEADRIVFDIGLQEAQAEGNVILDRSGYKIKCDSLRYNFKDSMGAGYNVNGQMGPLYFRMLDPKGKSAFEQVSANEVNLRGVMFTTDDFPDPMYSFKAKEVVAIPGERVMMHGVTLEIRGVPVLYLPSYTRSLGAGTPWFFKAGFGTESGFLFRLGYSYRHHQKVPSWEDDGTYIETQSGHLDTSIDLGTGGHGIGGGVDYRYQFSEDRHRGQIKAYGLSDGSRKFADDEVDDKSQGDKKQDPPDESQRWQLYAMHRSEIAKDIYMQLDVDEVSDPEIYYDVLDHFSEFEEGRRTERNAMAAITKRNDNSILRADIKVADRIGRDVFSDPSDPNNDNRDFDVEPGVEDKEDVGISKQRWGGTTMKAPEAKIATNDLELGSKNLYYRGELNMFNSKDRGLNIVDPDDDAWVTGGDFYNSLSYVHRFNERVTYLARFGVGAGIASRRDNGMDMVDGSKGFAPAGAITDPDNTDGHYDGLFFTDPRTFHVGQGSELASFDDVKDFFMYFDVEQQLNARFTDAFSGFISHVFRATTENSLGDFYANLGDQEIRQDLYNFPLREHWLRGGLNYNLIYPDIRLYTNAGINLTPAADMYPNEDRWYYTIGGEYKSDDGRWTTHADVRFAQTSIYHPSDPRTQALNSMSWGGGVRYTDPSEQWWAGIEARWEQFNNQNLNVPDDTTEFEEFDNRFRISPTVAARVGPKWTVVAKTNYDSRIGAFRDADFALNRDLHDALLSIGVRMRNDPFNNNNSSNNNNNNSDSDNEDEKSTFLSQLEMTFSVAPKLPTADPDGVTIHRNVLDRQFRPTVLATD